MRKGNRWTEARVRGYRTSHGIAVYREGEREERGDLTLQEAAERLEVSKMTVLREIRRGVIAANQAYKGAPWIIAVHALEQAQRTAPGTKQGSITADPNQKTFAL